MADPIVYTGLTLDEANGVAQYHARLGANVSVTGDGGGLFNVQVVYSSAGALPGGSGGNGSVMPGGNGPPGGGATPIGDGPPGGGDQIAWGKKVSLDFKNKVITICSGLGCDPSNLMAAMAFETGATFSPSKQNHTSGATGLIQFLPSTAEGLGTSVEALAQMTAIRQLDYVQQYLRPFGGRMHTLSDVYMTILFPRAVGKAEAYVLFAAPSNAYQQNRGLDVNHDGEVTKGEAASKVQTSLSEGLSSINRG